MTLSGRHGRFQPTRCGFPRAAGVGFRALADRVHAMGLHSHPIMRGFPLALIKPIRPILGSRSPAMMLRHGPHLP